MVFSSMLFLFLFLVLCYGIYLIVPGLKARNRVLLIFSLIFYAWGGPPLVLLLVLMTFVCYGGALILECEPMGHRRRTFYTAVTVGLCLGILGLFKYTGWLVGTVQDIFHLGGTLPQVALPIGISFYTFQLISYVVDVHRGETPAQRNYFTLLLYVSLFHQCIAGPIVRYVDVCNELHDRAITLNDTWQGLMRFTVGLAKKAVLANTCATIADSLLPSSVEAMAEQSALAVALGMLAYMLQIYLDFSAYSDMAIGMARMIGFHFKENFDYPYTAHSVSDFWRRWHISMSSFFRDYVYIPLGGNRVTVPRHILNILVVWGLTGLWHGASWNFVLWGLYFALFLLLEKFVFGWKKEKPHGVVLWLRRLYTLAVVYVGWMIFRFDDMALMGAAFKSLLGFGGGFADKTATTTALNYIFFLLVALMACSPIVPRVGAWLGRRQTADGAVGKVARSVGHAVAVAAPVLLLVLSALALVGDSYNPFLDFRF